MKWQIKPHLESRILSSLSQCQCIYGCKCGVCPGRSSALGTGLVDRCGEAFSDGQLSPRIYRHWKLSTALSSEGRGDITNVLPPRAVEMSLWGAWGLTCDQWWHLVCLRRSSCLGTTVFWIRISQYYPLLTPYTPAVQGRFGDSDVRFFSRVWSRGRYYTPCTLDFLLVTFSFHELCI